MTTKKHFVAVAQTVSQIQDAEKRRELAHYHAAIFAYENPRFNRTRFCAACNVPVAVKTTFPAIRVITA